MVTVWDPRLMLAMLMFSFLPVSGVNKGALAGIAACTVAVPLRGTHLSKSRSHLYCLNGNVAVKVCFLAA